MSRINVLDAITANQIKAGEVIERPSSIVKELVDNSLDAGATSITVAFDNGGISFIQVTDNGIGMDSEDAEKCFLIHATSKIRSIEDVYSLTTQGFRGEALASIAACADVVLETRQANSEYGTQIVYNDGKLISSGETACDYGTSVCVSDLFKNIPARYKFLKKDATEGMYITHLIERLSIVNPQVTFKLYKDGKLVLSTPGNGDMLDTIYSVFGKETASNLVKVDYEYEGLRIKGFTGKPSYTKPTRALQTFFVNERNIKNSVLTSSLDEAYRNLVMKGKFPLCFLCIYIPQNLVDVNVHPQKLDVRFNNEGDVFRLVYHGVRNAVLTTNESVEMKLSDSDTPEPAKVKSQISFDTSSVNSVLPQQVIARKVSQDNSEFDSLFPQNTNSSKSFTATERKVESNPDENEIKAYNQLLNTLSDISSNINRVPSESLESASLSMTSDNVNSESSVLNPVFAVDDDRNKSDFDLLLESDFIGFVFNTYIIMQNKSNMFLIDQHAAHERVLYEKFLEQYSKDSALLNKQVLMVPKVLSLGQADLHFVLENQKLFDKYGFEIEQIGDKDVAVRTVPFESRNVEIGKAVEQIIASAKAEVPQGDNQWFSLIATKACKAAIKGNQRIEREEALELLRLMRNLKDPYHCPHGRPTFVKLSQTDLEKEFKRIV